MSIAAWVAAWGACAGATTAPSSGAASSALLAAPPKAVAPKSDKPGRVTIERAFFIPGEQMFWAVSMRGITGVHATMVVGHPGMLDDREVIVVRSRVRTSGVVELVKSYYEEATSQVAMKAATPLSRQSIERRDGREIIIESRFVGDTIEHTRRREGGEPYRWQQSMPAGEPIYDNQTILGLVRAWTPERTGTRAYFYAVTDELLHRHEIRFSGHEDIRTLLGERRARRFDVDVFSGTSVRAGARRSDQSYIIWLSDDLARMPLLLAVPHRYGRIDMELIGYSRPHPNGTGDVVIRAGD